MTIRILLLFNAFLIGFLFFTKKENSAIEVEVKPKEYYKLPVVSHLSSDLCEGALGENIFEDGDFGSGTITNLPSDPIGYAPGYSYQPNPPPNDGFYTISNNTSAWGNFAGPNWIDIGDNSTDPNGYMMVVNASFDPSTFYEETITGLCENTAYQFSADVVNVLEPLNGIKPNLQFFINGMAEYSTGPVPENGSWNTYGFTFTTEPGQTSLDLSIRNNAPGGNGNDLAIDNIEFRACGPEIIIDTSIPFVCDGETASLVTNIIGNQYPTPYFQWELSTDNGATWTQLPGENSQDLYIGIPVDGYQYQLLVANSPANIANKKCSVISNVEVIVITPIFFTHFDTICQGLTLEVGPSVYAQTGVYLDSLIATYGCDSIVTTHLEVAPDLGIQGVYTLLDPSCPNEEDGTIIIDDVLNGSGIYEYSLDGGAYQTTPFFESLPIGNYTVSIRDHYGCEGTEEVELTNPFALDVDLGADISTSLGCEIFMQPVLNTIPETYQWIPSTGLSCTDCSNPILIATTTANYQLIITDANGCTNSDSVLVIVDKTRNVFIPNAFTPDGDGFNDHFIINAGKDVESIVQIEIFNRWGGLAFSNNNIPPNELETSWDGFVNGKEANIGVYIYVIDILFRDGIVETYSGDLTLIK